MRAVTRIVLQFFCLLVNIHLANFSHSSANQRIFRIFILRIDLFINASVHDAVSQATSPHHAHTHTPSECVWCVCTVVQVRCAGCCTCAHMNNGKDVLAFQLDEKPFFKSSVQPTVKWPLRNAAIFPHSIFHTPMHISGNFILVFLFFCNMRKT